MSILRKQVGDDNKMPELIDNRQAHPVHPAFEAKGGLRREEAIMMLRRFYLTENVHGELVPVLQRYSFRPDVFSAGPEIQSIANLEDHNSAV